MSASSDAVAALKSATARVADIRQAQIDRAQELAAKKAQQAQSEGAARAAQATYGQ